MTRRNLLGCIMTIIAGKEPPAFTPYLVQRRDGALSTNFGFSTRYWLDSFARTKSRLLLEIHGFSERELADETAD